MFTEDLIRENYGNIYKYCYRLLRDKTLAEDITQEVFLKFLNSMERYREFGKMKNYLYVIAGNTVRDYMKKASTVYETTMDTQTECPGIKSGFLYGNIGRSVTSNTTASCGNEEVDRLLDRIQVMEALDILELKDREMIILQYYHEMRLKEIAVIMQMPVSTVRYRLKQAEKLVGASACSAAGKNVRVSFCILYCIQRRKYKDDSSGCGDDCKRSVRRSIFGTGVFDIPQASGESITGLDNSSQTLHNSSV